MSNWISIRLHNVFCIFPYYTKTGQVRTTNYFIKKISFVFNQGKKSILVIKSSEWNGFSYFFIISIWYHNQSWLPFLVTRLPLNGAFCHRRVMCNNLHVGYTLTWDSAPRFGNERLRDYEVHELYHSFNQPRNVIEISTFTFIHKRLRVPWCVHLDNTNIKVIDFYSS